MNAKQLRALVAAQDALCEAWLATEDCDLATRIREAGVTVGVLIREVAGHPKEEQPCS